MNNSRSIFKSFSKKILKSEAFISMIIVCVLALGIIGTSYALYMDVDKDTDYQLVDVGDLSIGFENGSNLISLSNMTPSDDDIALKQSDNLYSFYVYNTGNYNTKFDIKLETVDGNQVDSQYIKYRLCKNNANNCKDVSTLSDNSVIHSEELQAKQTGDASNPSAYYFLRIWISNNYTSDTSKSLKLKVIIEAVNTENNSYSSLGQDDFSSNFAQTLIKSAKNASASDESDGIAVYRESPTTTVAEQASASTEASLSKTEDYNSDGTQNGYSYYFRGNVVNNYVNFSGMCWRVVRIDGSENVKLILEDQDQTCQTSDGNWNIPTTTGGSTVKGYFGYTTQGLVYKINYLSPTSYASTSQVTAYKNFQTGVLSSYLDKLVSGNWCYDDLAYTTKTGETVIEDKSSYYTNKTAFYYDSYVRLVGKSTKEPTLKCNGTVLSKYSDNTDMYVATLTADEIVYSGGKIGYANNNYYLINQYQKDNSLSFWLMTPRNFHNSDYDMPYYVTNSGMPTYGKLSSKNSFRPVITINSTITVTGDGTKTNPYVIE